jgi:hypothetical protein
VPLVYANTPEHSPLRRLVIDRLVCSKDPLKWITRDRNDCVLDGDMTHDIMEGLYKLKDAPKAPYDTDLCLYHAHKTGECYRVKYATKFGYIAPKRAAKV